MDTKCVIFTVVCVSCRRSVKLDLSLRFNNVMKINPHVVD